VLSDVAIETCESIAVEIIAEALSKRAAAGLPLRRKRVALIASASG
jgi:hypothetical protein